ncbi:MAG: glycine--tRNA ligase subunit beta, partial [Deinococcus-Thermus bacterium]|nr:glycine--tRNA ligase subunit beta [Deinococcota bacterium]
MPDLLIELLSEEIPARMQARAAADLKRLTTDGLVEAGLTYAHAGAYVTPRRLTLAVEGLSAASPTVTEERKGPRVDAPEKAVQGFLRATGLTPDQLERRETPKGEVWFAEITRPGRPAAEIVAEVLDGVVRGFPWPKAMRWGGPGLPGNGTLRWVRPLHSILCLLAAEEGAEVVDLEIEGIRAGDTTRGHRFMAPEPFAVTSFDDYAAKLKRAKVMLDPEERAETIRHDAANLAFAAGLELVEDRGLLAEVAGLVEWPVTLMGAIDARFLDLPEEVLRTSMKEHQKFFSVRDPARGQIVRFVTVAGRETADDGATILAGNRKVLAARLADAEFFWENDRRTIRAGGMAAMAAPLADVTFERRLGSEADRIARIAALAREIAPVVGADPDLAEEAARVCKADLASEMVYEFPELQGVMGGHYARLAGLPEAVAAACADHYRPLGPGDAVPDGAVARAVALADKLDMLTGFWAIDEKPTGSRDPFALRRAALGVIRILLESGARCRLDRFFDSQLLRHALHVREVGDGPTRELVAAIIDEIAEHGVFGAALRAVIDRAGAKPAPLDALETEVPDASDDLLAFFHERMKVHLRDAGIRHDVIDACLGCEPRDDLVLLERRARALQAGIGTEEGRNLIQGFKRAANILAQAEAADGVAYEFGPDPKFAATEEERALFAALDAADARIAPALAAEDFAAAMRAMAELRGPIDAFFEAVQVNTDNPIVRRNR